ncbi:MAG: hypothetical protein ACJ8LG_12015 [Massilia sp.]
MDGMEERVQRLESTAEKTADRLSAIELDVAILKATSATKTDIAELRTELRTAIAEAKTSIILWVVSAIFLAQMLPAVLKKFGL